MRQKEILLNEVLTIVKEETGIAVAEVPPSRRTADIVDARAIAATLMRDLGFSSAETAAAMGVTPKTVLDLLYAFEDRQREQGFLFRCEFDGCKRKLKELMKKKGNPQE